MSHFCIPKEPKDSARALIVNNLERVYGPVFVVAFYAFFFAFSDGGQEAILGYLNEVATLFGGQSDLAPSDPVVIRMLSTTVLLFLVPIAGYSLTAWVLRECKMENKWVWPFLVGVPFVSLGGFAWGFIRARLSEEFTADKWVLLVPLVAGAAMLRFALYVLVKDAEGDEELQIRRWVQKGEAALTDWFEQTPAPLRWTWRLWVSIGKGQVDKGTRDKIEKYTPFILGAAVLIVMAVPYSATFLGPLGMAALAAIVIMSVLAHLTVFSARYMPGHFPMILALIAMGIAAMSWLAAAGLGVTCLVLLWYLLKRRTLSKAQSGKMSADQKADWNRRHENGKYVCFGFVVLFAAYAGLGGLYKNCGSLTDCNLQRGTELKEKHANLGEAVTAFEESHPDNKKMRVVAAQGGGLYAAYHAAYYLALRADTEPGFAESVFAVSGISGGSVGAGVYWAIRKSGICAENLAGDCHVQAVRNILRRDYLSPVLSGLLIRDNLDSVLPFTALWPWPVDRGHVMEDMLVKFLRKHNADKLGEILEGPFSESPDFDKGAPLLLLNTNWADTGENWVASPLREYANGHSGRILTVEGNDLSMRNAMVNSARFPFVTPPGRVRVLMAVRCFGTLNDAGKVEYDDACMARDKFETETQDTFKTDIRYRPADLRDCIDAKDPKDSKDQCMFKEATYVAQLVDGGYFDSSGVETVMTLLSSLQEEGGAKPGYEIEVLVLTSAGKAEDPKIKGFVGAPASAFLGAWGSRSDHSIAHLNEFFGKDADKLVKITENRIRPDTFNYTLSWYLTPGTFDDIEKLVKAAF